MIVSLIVAAVLAAQYDGARGASEPTAAATAVAANTTEHHGDSIRGAVYDPTRDADADVAAALNRARAAGKLTMIVLGGNWCHDSRALAEHFAEDDFAAMLRSRYEIVYVDVGHRDRNLQIPARHGVTALAGTPTVLVLSPAGALLNRGTVSSWRNAASRRRSNIFSHFSRLADEYRERRP